MLDFTFKNAYTADDLIQIVAILRDPENGCPWDKVQTHQSIRMNFIEETYEVLDAIDLDDSHLMCEELGDVMMQVALHSQMECERGNFCFDDVCDGVCKKLISRHPHIFGGSRQELDPEGALVNWDAIKNKEKGRSTARRDLEDVPAALPALMRAEKLQKRASGYGYAGYDMPHALQDLDEETAELKQAVDCGKGIKEELGDVLFAAVQVARAAGINPEDALSEAARRFTERVICCEELAAKDGESLKALDEQHRRALWKQAKEQLSEGR